MVESAGASLVFLSIEGFCMLKGTFIIIILNILFKKVF